MRAKHLATTLFTSFIIGAAAVAQNQWPIIVCSPTISELRPVPGARSAPGKAHADWLGEVYVVDRGWGWTPNFIRFYVTVNDQLYAGPSMNTDTSYNDLPLGPPGVWIAKNLDISLQGYPRGWHVVRFHVQTRTYGETGNLNNSTIDSFAQTLTCSVYNPVGNYESISSRGFLSKRLQGKRKAAK